MWSLRTRDFPESIEATFGEKDVLVVIPPRATKKRFSKKQMEETRAIAGVRIHVERSIQRIKMFNILNNKYSSSSSFSRSSSVVGGNSYHGDNVRANVNSGVNVVLYKSSDTVKAKPVGNKEYIYKPSKSSLGGTSSEVKVNDFNVNISGTIRLDGGRNSKDIDISKLLSNQEFVSSLKEMIKTSINNDINCGKLMNDDALRRGMPAQTSLWGRK